MEENDSQYWNNVLKSADLLLSLLAPYEKKEDMDLVQNVLPPLRQLVRKGSSYLTANPPILTQSTLVQPVSAQPALTQPAPTQSIPVTSTPVQPILVQPTPVKPTPVQPAAVQPTSVQPTSVQPKQEHASSPRRHKVNFGLERNWTGLSKNQIEIVLNSGRVVHCIVVNTPEGLDKAIEQINQAEYVSLDCEFMGSKKAIPELKLLQIAVSDSQGYAIQVDLIDRDILHQKLKPLLESKDKEWIGWALRSDMLSIEQFFDTIQVTKVLDLQKKLATYAVEELNLHAAVVKYASDWDAFHEFQRAKQFGDTFWFSDDDCIWRLNPLPPRAIVYAIFDVLSVHILHKRTSSLNSKPEFFFPVSVTHNLSNKALVRWNNQRSMAATQMPNTSPRNHTKRYSNNRRDKKSEFSLPVPVSPEPETNDGYDDNNPQYTLDVQKALALSLKSLNRSEQVESFDYEDLIQGENNDRIICDLSADEGETSLQEEVTLTWGHKKFESPFLGDHLRLKQERFSRPREQATPPPFTLGADPKSSWSTKTESSGWTMNDSANPSWHTLAENAESSKSVDFDESSGRNTKDSIAGWNIPSKQLSAWKSSSAETTSNNSHWSKPSLNQPSSNQPIDNKKPTAQGSNWRSAASWKDSAERQDWQNNTHSQWSDTKPTSSAARPIPEQERSSKQHESSASSSWQSSNGYERSSPARTQYTSPHQKPATIAHSPNKFNTTLNANTTHTYTNKPSTHLTPESNNNNNNSNNNSSNNNNNSHAATRSSPMVSNTDAPPLAQDEKSEKEASQPRVIGTYGRTGAFTWHDDSGSNELGAASWASFATTINQKWDQGIDTQVEEIEKAPKVSNPNTSKQFNINVNPYDTNKSALGEEDNWNVQEVQPDTMEMPMNQIPIRKVFTGPRVVNPNDSMSEDSEDDFDYSRKSTPPKKKGDKSKKYSEDDEVSMIGLKIRNFESQKKNQEKAVKVHTTSQLPTFIDSIFIFPQFNTEEINIHSIMEVSRLDLIEIPSEPFTVVICYHFTEVKSNQHVLKALQLFIKATDDPVGDSYTIVLEKACVKDRSLKNTKFGKLLTDPSIRRVCWCPEVIEEQTYQRLGFTLGPTVDLNVKVNFDEDREVLPFYDSIDSYLKDWADLYLFHDAKKEYDAAFESKQFSGTPWDNKRIKEGVLRYSALQGFGAYALYKATEDLDILEGDYLWKSTKYASK